MGTDDVSKPVGRPPIYTPELAAVICERMAEGESLRQICRDEAMPAKSTVMKWVLDIPEFADQYARSRQLLIEHWEEEQLEIADDGSNDWIERETRSGRMVRVLDDEHVRRSQLRIDTRKWLMSKLLPKKYGDRVVNQNQQLDANGNPMTPGPSVVIFPQGGPGSDATPGESHIETGVDPEAGAEPTSPAEAS